MRRILWLALLVAATYGPAAAQDESIAALRRMFDYDQKAPLDLKEVGVINRTGVRIHDITYAHDVRSLIDRANWLRRHIGMKPVAPLLLQRAKRA